MGKDESRKDVGFWHRIAHCWGLNEAELVWEMVAGGGPAYGLRCKTCGEIEWVNYNKGAAMDRDKRAVHTGNYEG